MLTTLRSTTNLSAFFTIIWMSFLVCSDVSATEPLVNINHAAPAHLASKLPGIGPAKAKAIVLYREAHGPFKTIEELMLVKGIGTRTLEKIRVFVFIGDDSSAKHNIGDIGANRLGAVQSQANAEMRVRRAVRSVIDLAQRKTHRTPK